MTLDYNVLFSNYTKITQLTVELFTLKVSKRLKGKRNKSLQSCFCMSSLLLLRLRWVHVVMVSNPYQKRHAPDSENCGLTHPSSRSLASAVSQRTPPTTPDESTRLLSTCVTLSHLAFGPAASCHESSNRLTSRKLKIPPNTFQPNVAHGCQIIWRHFPQTVQGYESTPNHISVCAPNS